jgi:peptide/nickel transport system permease protein
MSEVAWLRRNKLFSFASRGAWLRRNKLLAFAAVFVALQVVLALGATWIAPYDPTAQSVAQRLKGPSALHWLGTDQFGRDVLARILHGYRTSLLACTVAVGIALLFGGTFGLLAAYYRGWLDRVLMRLMDVLFAFPVMLLAIGIIAVLGPHTSSAAIAIAVVYTPIFARLLRGPALVICESEYVLGARAVGASDGRIMIRHVLPNLASVILVQTSLLLSAAVLVEASLSFLGLGTQPPTPSLGLMLAEGRNFLLLSPWSAVFAGFAILFLSFGFNLLGDALRDTLDPRLRGRTGEGGGG